MLLLLLWFEEATKSASCFFRRREFMYQSFERPLIMIPQQVNHACRLKHLLKYYCRLLCQHHLTPMVSIYTDQTLFWIAFNIPDYSVAPVNAAGRGGISPTLSTVPLLSL